MEIRSATRRDKAFWLETRRAIWPHDSKEAHERAISDRLAEDNSRCVLVFHDDGKRMGFVEGRIDRPSGAPDAHGVGVIESWYVLPNFRWEGIGHQILAAAEEWFRQQGCGELRAEGQLGKEASYKAHVPAQAGKEPRQILFRKLPLEGEDEE
jgi:aminoglycoside 6'-N-acetyltransferase I